MKEGTEMTTRRSGILGLMFSIAAVGLLAVGVFSYLGMEGLRGDGPFALQGGGGLLGVAAFIGLLAMGSVYAHWRDYRKAGGDLRFAMFYLTHWRQVEKRNREMAHMDPNLTSKAHFQDGFYGYRRVRGARGQLSNVRS